MCKNRILLHEKDSTGCDTMLDLQKKKPNLSFFLR